jgi:hypothetical protein
VSNAKPPVPPSTEPAETPKRPQDWTALERAQAVLAASQADESELGEFLRRRGCVATARRVDERARGGDVPAAHAPGKEWP